MELLQHCARHLFILPCSSLIVLIGSCQKRILNQVIFFPFPNNILGVSSISSLLVTTRLFSLPSPLVTFFIHQLDVRYHCSGLEEFIISALSYPWYSLWLWPVLSILLTYFLGFEVSCFSILSLTNFLKQTLVTYFSV